MCTEHYAKIPAADRETLRLLMREDFGGKHYKAKVAAVIAVLERG